MSDRRYENEFRWESPYGRVVTLIEQHAPPGGLVLDLGCGFGAVAEPLAERGFGYVGCDVHEAALGQIAERGHEIHTLDLTEHNLLEQRLRDIAADRPVSAITMIDALEHLADTNPFLDALRASFDDLQHPLLVVSIPNVAHADLGAKLISGRWDVTQIGLLDETHLRFFTLDSLLTTFGARGWEQVAEDDYRLAFSDQHFPRTHPALSGGAPLGQLLRVVRDAADPWGEVNQFVRAFTTEPIPEQSRHEPETFLTAIVLTADNDSQRARTREALASIHTSVLEIVDVDAGNHSAVLDAVARARGDYVAMVPEGHIVPSSWLATLQRGAAEFPGRVLRVASEDPSPASLRSVIDLSEFARLQDIVRPPGALASYALPLQLRRYGTKAADAPTGVQPWQVVASAIQLLGVDVVRGEPVLGVDGAPARGLDDGQFAQLADTLRDLPLLLPLGASERLLRLLETLGEVERSTSWRVTFPLRAASGAGRRLARRFRRGVAAR